MAILGGFIRKWRSDVLSMVSIEMDQLLRSFLLSVKQCVPLVKKTRAKVSALVSNGALDGKAAYGIMQTQSNGVRALILSSDRS